MSPRGNLLKVFAIAALVMVLMASCGVVRSQTSGNETAQCIYFFYADGCSACETAKTYMIQVQQEFPNLMVHNYEIHNSTNYNLMEQYYNMHNITTYEYPVVFIGSDVLIDVTPIESQLVSLLENSTGVNCPFVNSTSTTTGKTPNLAIIIGYAFADSLNPCAISVLLILIALSVATVGIWKTGVSYILGNFVAYLLIGVGLFTVLQQFNLPVYLSKVIGGATIVLAVFTLYSRIPGASRPTIKKLLHAATSPIFAFIAGAAISAIELPCTVGPYFLALTLVTQYNVSQWALLGYLLLYNTIFIMPLIVVLLAYHFAGVTEVPKKYIRWTSAILLLFLGVVLLVF